MSSAPEPDPSPDKSTSSIEPAPLGLWGYTWRIVLIAAAIYLSAKAIYDFVLPPLYAPHPPITVGHDTTRIDGPLDAEGFVDYAAAIDEEYRKGVTPEKNAALALFALIGPAGIDEKFRDEFFKRLGMSAPPLDGDYLTDATEWKLPEGFEAVQEQEVRKQKINIATSRPWRDEEFPQLAAWLDANQKHVPQAISVTERPQWYSPRVNTRDPEIGMMGGSDGILAVMLVNDLLALQAMRDVANGKLDESWRIAAALERLAATIYTGPTTVHWVCAWNIQGRSRAIRRACALHPQSPPEWREEVRKIALATARVPSRKRQVDRFERFAVLDVVRITAQRKPAGAPYIDWNVACRDINQWFDETVAALDIEEEQEQTDKFVAATYAAHWQGAFVRESVFFWALDWLRGYSGRTLTARAIAYELNRHSHLLYPFHAQERQKESSLLTVVTLEVENYRRQHGKYPASLADLPPEVTRPWKIDGQAEPRENVPVFATTDEGCVVYIVREYQRETYTMKKEDLENNQTTGLYMPVVPAK